jgi:predicted phosphoribosyltransferase
LLILLFWSIQKKMSALLPSVSGYRDFAQTPDEEVIELLERSREELERGAAGPDRKMG